MVFELVGQWVLQPASQHTSATLELPRPPWRDSFTDAGHRSSSKHVSFRDLLRLAESMLAVRGNFGGPLSTVWRSLSLFREVSSSHALHALHVLKSKSTPVPSETQRSAVKRRRAHIRVCETGGPIMVVVCHLRSRADRHAQQSSPG